MATTKITKEQGGVPPAGTTGQALVKLSNTDYDYDWGASSGFTSIAAEQALGSVADGDGGMLMERLAVSSDNNSLFILVRSITTANNLQIWRYQKDAITGMYYRSHSASVINVSNVQIVGVVILGAFVYVFWQSAVGAPLRADRFSAADLTGQAVMTIVGATSWGGTGDGAFTDGTDLFVCRTSSQFDQLTVVGTTVTFVQTITGGLASTVDASYDIANNLVYMNNSSNTVSSYTIVGAVFVLQASINKPIPGYLATGLSFGSASNVLFTLFNEPTAGGSELVRCILKIFSTT